MPRDLPLGNGALLVNFDQLFQLRDLYWPHVGEENHTAGHPFRFGVWVEGQFRWLSDARWQRTLNYTRDTLVAGVMLTHPELELTLECQDTVDFHENLYLRKLTVHNTAKRAREVRLFFAQDFHIAGHAVGDSAYYEPERQAVYHYKGQYWFMINCAKAVEDTWELGVDQWAVGTKESQGHEGTWRDAEDGTLSGHAAAQGSVDSCVALHLTAPAEGAVNGWYWIAVGADFKEVTRINRLVRQRGPDTYIHRTDYYWNLWVTKEDEDLSALPAEICHRYRRSLLIIRTQIDNGGAILAATDYDVARYYNDTYAYTWPRDGALTAAALIDAGYAESPRDFFDFCHRVITPEGYLLHKYNPDGSLASSWLGWYYYGKKDLPVQEDETALVLWALWRHFQRFRTVERIKPLFRGLVVRAANWMVEYRDPATGLPHPSWDLWEERRGISAWTIGAVWGGLQAAAQFAKAFGEFALAEIYQRAAEQMREAALKYLWLPGKACFARLLIPQPDGSFTADETVESSLMGLWYFGMLSADNPWIVQTMQAVREQLWVKTPVGGIARYQDDKYYRVTDDTARVPGNPWFVCTLWLAQWYIAVSRTPEDLKPASELLCWAADHALPSGVMPEQINPFTNEPLSVSPLTWSHATFVLAVREYLHKLQSGPCYTDWAPHGERGCEE